MIEQDQPKEELTEAFKAVGQRLRQARIDSGLSLSDVSSRVHLPGSIISDLEQGRIAHLAPIYRRGYLSNYARVLGLDPAQIIDAATADEPPPLQRVLPVSDRMQSFNKYINYATYVIVSTVIVLPLVWFFVEGGSRLFERSPEIEAQSSLIADLPSVEATEATESLDQVAHGESSVGAGPASSPVVASAMPIKPRPLREALALPGPELVAEPGLEQIEHGDEPLDIEQRLSIRVVEDSWIEIHDAANQRLEYDLLRAGTTRSYRGEAPFRILLGRANAVQLEIDGVGVEHELSGRPDVARFEILADGQTR